MVNFLKLSSQCEIKRANLVKFALIWLLDYWKCFKFMLDSYYILEFLTYVFIGFAQIRYYWFLFSSSLLVVVFVKISNSCFKNWYAGIYNGALMHFAYSLNTIKLGSFLKVCLIHVLSVLKRIMMFVVWQFIFWETQ